jgi:ubiquinol-cytochrome c reductase cytochrome c1 subunit
MKKWIATLALTAAMLPAGALAAGGGAKLMHVDVNLSKSALKDGARTFVNQCMGCHSAKFFRYKNLVDDLGMSKSDVEQGLLLGNGNVNDHMTTAMPKEQASKWFGTAPPDLSLTTRVRGTDWVYTYLLGFYRDHDSSTGWNNHVFTDVSMPNVLYPEAPEYFDAMPKPHHGKGKGEEGHGMEYPEVPEALDNKVTNLVSFMRYAAEPAVLDRRSMGPWVLGFLVVLAVLTFLVKKEYWRDIH